MNPYKMALNRLQIPIGANLEWSMVRLFLTALSDREDADPQPVVLADNPFREILRRHDGNTFAHQRLRHLFSRYINE